ncbi:MAG: phosphotransferase [Planctomycetota bacterium]|jgi:thiamine kinase-like enzyme
MSGAVIDPALLCRLSGATAVDASEPLQELWSGYGRIVRYHLRGGAVASVVVKEIDAAGVRAHPRGWATDVGHQRKLRSYQVERHWYQNWSSRVADHCRLPRCLATDEGADGRLLLVLEDLDAAGFGQRRHHASRSDMEACLAWLAMLHAQTMQRVPDGLWSQGTYWHLATRPDELAAMDDERLRVAAAAIDRQLRGCPYQAIVHGDAKLANFCFGSDAAGAVQVAAVDFQYVGGGCGMSDVAYFISSCLDEDGCARHADDLLAWYDQCLEQALRAHRPELDATAVVTAWRTLYPVAWADFVRFLAGWSPGHWKLHGYSLTQAERALAMIGPVDGV